jgi:hypothetical protein
MDLAVADPAHLAARVRLSLAATARDPLTHWRFAVPRLREAMRLFVGPDPIDELHMRGPNKTGKTLTKTAFVLACLQKKKTLDGVPLPTWPGPVKALQLVLDNPQQLLSVKPAYLELLGGWPAHVRYNGDYLASIRVMPEGGDPEDEREWSVIYFLSQKNPDTGRGARADIVDFDEPPDMFFLRELRKAGRAGRRSIRVIGETPEHLREWAELREDYGDTPRRSIRRVDQDRAEVRWSLDEVEGWVLSEAEKAKLRRSYANDPLRDAREHGDYTNAEGSTPWGEQGMLTLLELRASCVTPTEEAWTVTREVTEAGETAKVLEVPVQVWAGPKAGSRYYIDIDPASGVDDGKHNPAGLHVSEMGSGDLVARWNGYLAPYSLGVLAAGLARQYHDAAIDVEMKDHWGANVVRGVQASRYGNLCFEQRELRPGQWAKEVGFDQNEETKAIIIGQIQEWLAAYRAGHQYAACPSRHVIETLINAELDERGKVVAGPGVAHGEDLILWGQKLRRAVSRLNREIPDLARAPESSQAALIRKIRGLDHDETPAGGLLRPKARPRV